MEENPLARILLCKVFRKKKNIEKIIQKGYERVDRQLDVRSLIMTQNMLTTLIRLLIKPRVKRQLMRIQRKPKVLEPHDSSDTPSSAEDIDYDKNESPYNG